MRYKLWSCQNICDALAISLIIFTFDLVLSYTNKLFVFYSEQIVFHLIFENQADVIGALNSTCRR